MNFIQGLLNPQKGSQKNIIRNDEEDYQRLLQLCNSYGLDQKETAQLIEQFKKGNYNSVNNSILNQSSVADDSLIQQRNNYQDSFQQHQNSQKNIQHNQNNASYTQMTFNDKEESSLYHHQRSNHQQMQGHSQAARHSRHSYHQGSTDELQQKLYNNKSKYVDESKGKKVNLIKQQIQSLIRQKNNQLRSIQQLQQEEEYAEMQNQMLQKMESLQKENQQYKIRFCQLNQQNQHLLRQNQFLKQKLKQSNDKVNSFIKIQESETVIVTGLKDTIVSLTKLLQQKQLFCQDLQNKINQTFFGSSTSKNQRVGGASYFQRNSFDRQKTLDRNQSYKNMQNENSLKIFNQQNPRKQLGDLTNISLNGGSQNGRLIRENSMKKLNNLKDKESVKRNASRIDIKKYKGMIQQLRSNYGH